MTASTRSRPAARHRAAADELTHEIGRLGRATHQIKAHLAAREPDVEWASYALLFHLVREGPRRSSVLAEAVGVDPSTASRQVTQLAARGLVAREPDPADGRASLLRATDEGVALTESMTRRRQEAFARMLTDWPVEDLRRLADLLARFNDTFAAHRSDVLEALTGSGPRLENS